MNFRFEFCPRAKKTDRGFSLTELLIVIAVLLVVVAIAVPHLLALIDQANTAKAVGDINAIETDVVWYQTTYGTLPDNLTVVGDQNLLDPWGHSYEYLNHGDTRGKTKGNGKIRTDRFSVDINSDYELYSAGKDGQSAAKITSKTGQDDIIRADNGDYVGPASDY